MANRLAQQGKTAIEQNADLFASVCNALGVKPTALPSMLIRDSRRLIEYPVLAVISEFLKVEMEELIETIDETVEEKVA